MTEETIEDQVFRRGVESMYATRNVTKRIALDRCLSDLRANERAALVSFVEQLRLRYGDDLRRVVLFGSKARGDSDDESDLDLLVVVRGVSTNYQRCWNEVVDLVWPIELDHGVVTSLVVKDETEYAMMCEHQLLLARNIEQDGIELWTTQPSAPTSESV